jgi:hypothetical protein
MEVEGNKTACKVSCIKVVPALTNYTVIFQSIEEKFSQEPDIFEGSRAKLGNKYMNLQSIPSCHLLSSLVPVPQIAGCTPLLEASSGHRD